MAKPQTPPPKALVAPPPPLSPAAALRIANHPSTYADFISEEAGLGKNQIAPTGTFDIATGADGKPAAPGQGDYSQFAPAGSAAPAEIDWAKVYFGQYNLPSDLIGQIESLGKQYGTTNPDVFYNSALNAVRGSDWFATTYPGFANGVRAGLFTDETGYRGYVSALSNVYQQYLGRHVSGDETAAALAQGATPGLIGNQFQGDTIAKTNANDWQYATGAFDANGPLTSAEQTAYGREQAGIDTPLGQMVQKRVQQAMGRATALFGGNLVSPSLSLTQGRVSAPSLGRGTPDVGA